ncbi:zinc finger protein 384-like [Lineus longissimus]|uniref:zinc finger protein 384-like n=1 Tax=Lineus longissimus TaxID=88925 RepID=UPI00315CA9BC
MVSGLVSGKSVNVAVLTLLFEISPSVVSESAKFCNKSDVYRHGKETHGLEDKAHPCPHCYKSFSSPSQLHQHSLVHTGERKYHCKYCNKAFKQLSHLQQHTRIHTGEKPYKCSIPNCNKAFAQLSNLQHHQRNHDQNKAKSSRKSFYCTVCQRGFVTESSLDKHIARLHAHLSSHSMSSHVSSPVKVTASMPMSPSTSSGQKSSPHSPPVMSPEPNNGQINPHLHQMVAQGMQNLQSHGSLTSPLPHRHMSASANNLMDDGGLSDPMAPLRSPVDQDNRMQNSQIQAAHSGQRGHHHHHHQQQQNMLSSMGVGTHTGLPPISRLSDRCFPLAPPLPAAALAAVRAQALSSLNYGSPGARASLTSMHRSTSPNGHQT